MAGAKQASRAFTAYLAIALVMTWPLARGLARDVAWDLGDPALNMWILSWDCEQFRAILGGHWSHLRHFFDANIFYPAPLTLAYSEHLVPEAIQIFPVYELTRNPILCYNLLFLSTFALSGLGMFLFARELTGNAAAAFVGGLLFAFVPYRLPQSSHLQMLSAQWMPFALYGFRRWTETGRTRALVGATAAVVVEGLSCGYYLLYFSPFAAAYVVWELWRRDRLIERRAWIGLAIAAICAAGAILPFVIPYARVNRDLQLARSLTEVTRLSADVYSYATASTAERFWGSRLSDVFPKPEGELFPGVVIILLAFVGVIAWKPAAVSGEPVSAGSGRGVTATILWCLAMLHLAAAVATIVFRRLTIHTWLFDIRLNDVTQLLLRAAILYALALLISPGARRRAASFMASRGFFVFALAAAMWLSLGPAPQVLGRPLDLASPYAALWNHVPGFEGLRVPARFAMIAMLMLSTLGALGAAVLARRRLGTIVLTVVSLAFLFEASAAPFTVNGASPVRGYATPEPRLYPSRRAPAIYHQVATLPAGVVLAELPVGQTDWDVRAMFYSSVHWRPIVNGYSGFFPPAYGRETLALGEIPRHARISLDMLHEIGVTHLIVHENAFLDSEGRDTTAALRQAGAQEIFRDGGDVLLALR
jgi:hypothetical protein